MALDVLLPALLAREMSAAQACNTIHEAMGSDDAPQDALLRSLCLCAEAALEVRATAAQPLRRAAQRNRPPKDVGLVPNRDRAPPLAPAGGRPGVREAMRGLLRGALQEVRRGRREPRCALQAAGSACRVRGPQITAQHARSTLAPRHVLLAHLGTLGPERPQRRALRPSNSLLTTAAARPTPGPATQPAAHPPAAAPAPSSRQRPTASPPSPLPRSTPKRPQDVPDQFAIRALYAKGALAAAEAAGLKV
jgi:hypothetical protein